MTLAEQIAEALRDSMARPGYGYIDFHWRPDEDDYELVQLAEEIVSFMPDSLDAALADVEASLPVDAWIKIEGPHDAPHADWYTVEAVQWTEHTTKVVRLAKIEAPLGAALRALAAKLREAGR